MSIGSEAVQPEAAQPEAVQAEAVQTEAVQAKTVQAKQTEFDVIPAQEKHIAGIQALLNHYAAMGDLLPRTKSDIIANLEHFRVIEKEAEVIACGSLEHFTPELAEIRSLMVAADIKRGGLGKKVVETLIGMAMQREVRRLMALTYVPEFFHKLGFKTVDKRIFPEKIWGICVNCYKFRNCDEIAVLLQIDRS